VQRELLRVFGRGLVTVTEYQWRDTAGNRGDSVCGNSTLEGDSTFLRVLGARKQSRQGHVLSAANIQTVVTQLRRYPPPGVCVMIGTNDVLFTAKQQQSSTSAKSHVRGQLMKMAKVLQ